MHDGQGLPPVCTSPTKFRRHRLHLRELDAIARGRGDRSTFETLAAAERSRRILLMRHLVDSVMELDFGGPLPDPVVAWRLLIAAQSRSPAALSVILDHPPTGQWLADTARRRTGSLARDGVPLWYELGYVHALAASAGIRAGLSFSIRVPARDGVVVLPTLGAARISPARPYGTAEVRAEAGRASIHAANTRVSIRPLRQGDSWYHIPRLSSGPDGRRTGLALDSVDPYRRSKRLSYPQYVSPIEQKEWKETFENAWDLLTRDHPHTVRMLEEIPQAIIPLPGSPFHATSLSSKDAFGAIMMSLPEDPVRFAVTVAHESCHSTLIALMHLFSLIDGSDDREQYYAPWRNDPRPLAGLLHGAFSHIEVADFWRVHRQRSTGSAATLAHFEFAHLRMSTREVVQTLYRRPEMTDLGRRFVAGMAERMAGWLAEPVPGQVLLASAAMAADQRALWRIRHLRPDPEAVVRLAKNWLSPESDEAVACASSVVPDPASTTSHPRGTLTRIRLGLPDLFRELQADPSVISDRVPYATPADLVLTAGLHKDAATRYREKLAADPTDAVALTGLALTQGTSRAGRLLLDRPEVVRALQLEIVQRTKEPADPLNLAGWLADRLIGGTDPNEVPA